VNLVWMCRDADLIEHYLHTVPLDTERAWTFIFYTGKRRLMLNSKLKRNSLLKIFKGRPQLEDLVCDIVDSVSNNMKISDGLIQQARDMEDEIWGQSNIDPVHEILETLCRTYRW